MSPNAEQMLTDLLALPEAERIEFAEALLAASEPPSPEPSGTAWLAELERRSAAVDAGQAVLTPWDVVKTRVANRLRERFDG